MGCSALVAGIAFLPMTVAHVLPGLGRRPPGAADRAAPADDGRAAGDGCGGAAAACGSGPTRLRHDVFPGVALFGLGLCVLVAPLTATVLAAASDEHAGVASGVNNAVARSGSLLAVAALPVAVGLTAVSTTTRSSSTRRTAPRCWPARCSSSPVVSSRG